MRSDRSPGSAAESGVFWWVESEKVASGGGGVAGGLRLAWAMNLVILIPVLLVVGAIFILWSSRRTRSRKIGPLTGQGTSGRPDRDEPVELRGPEEHKHRR